MFRKMSQLLASKTETKLHKNKTNFVSSITKILSLCPQDIVEAAERPNLAAKSDNKYDRFGFAIDTSGNSIEEKVESLRKQAEDHHHQLDEGAHHVSDILHLPTITFRAYRQRYFSHCYIFANGKKPKPCFVRSQKLGNRSKLTPLFTNSQ